MEEEFVPDHDQLTGIKFIAENPYGMLLYDAGVGKTSTILFGYDVLREAALIDRLMVLSSINILNDTWPPEIERWRNLDVTYAKIMGNERRRRSGFDLDANVYLLNNENIEWFYDEFGTKWLERERWMLYVDESSMYRNRNTHRFRALRKMLPKFRRRYVGTATPTPKGYLNLYSQMYIVDMGAALGVTLGAYRNQYFIPGGFKGKEWRLREGAEVDIQRAISHRVHRVEKHLDVTIEFEDIIVTLPPKARKVYDELEREFITEWRNKTLVAANAAVATGKLRQVANGAIYHHDEETGMRTGWVKVHDEKIEALKKLIKRLNGKPLLLAYEFAHDYESMQRAGLDFPSYSRAKKGEPRSALLRQWNSGRLKVLSSQIGAMSHGLNAQSGGHYLAYYGLNYDLEKFSQFYQRLWRRGQKNNVIGFRIVAKNTVDEVMMDVLRVRDGDQKMLLDALKRRYDL